MSSILDDPIVQKAFEHDSFEIMENRINNVDTHPLGFSHVAKPLLNQAVLMNCYNIYRRVLLKCTQPYFIESEIQRTPEHFFIGLIDDNTLLDLCNSYILTRVQILQSCKRNPGRLLYLLGQRKLEIEFTYYMLLTLKSNIDDDQFIQVLSFLNGKHSVAEKDGILRFISEYPEYEKYIDRLAGRAIRRSLTSL